MDLDIEGHHALLFNDDASATFVNSYAVRGRSLWIGKDAAVRRVYQVIVGAAGVRKGGRVVPITLDQGNTTAYGDISRKTRKGKRKRITAGLIFSLHWRLASNHISHDSSHGFVNPPTSLAVHCSPNSYCGQKSNSCWWPRIRNIQKWT